MESTKKKSVRRKPIDQKPIGKRLKKYAFLYIFALPGLAYLFINNYMPMVGLSLAFKDYSFALGIFKSPWCGIKNFTYLFASKWAKIMFRNTICYNLVFLVLGTLFAIFVAIVLGEIQQQRLKNLYQTIILIPHLVSMVLVSYIVFAFLSADTGFINNRLIIPLGGTGIKWYLESKYWPFILTFVHLWKGFGFSSIIYYATIIGFDKSYYEAAVVDGATVWQQITKITMPLLKPTVIILTIMSLGRIFGSDFGLFYQTPMNSGPLYEITTTIDVFVYRAMMTDHDVGRSLSAGFLQSCLGFIVVMITNFTVRKIEPESALF